MAFKIRQGPTADRQAFVPAQGELIYDTVTKEVYVGDGSTLGGISVSGGALDSDGVQDLSAALLTSGTHSGITFTYDDSLAKLNAVVNFPVQAVNYNFNVTGVDSTQRTINNGETIQFLGTGGIDVVVDTEGRVTVDGSNIVGGGGISDLSNVHFFVASTDSTVAQINNNETVKFVGAGSVTVTVNTEGQLTFTGTALGTVGENFSAINAIPYYNGAGRILAPSNAALTFDPALGILYSDKMSTSRIQANSIITNNSGDGLNIYPTTSVGSNPFVAIGGVVGAADFDGRLRLLNNSGYLVWGSEFKLAEIASIHNSTKVNTFNFTRARGTYTALAIPQSGDEVGAITWSSYSGNLGATTLPGAAIYGTLVSAPSNGSTACSVNLNIQTADATGTLKDAIFIGSNQDVRIFEKLIVGDHITIDGNVIQSILSNADLELRANGTGQVRIDDNAYVYGDLTVNGSGILYTSRIDTSDSSALTIIPAATFMSDVTVQNDLVVTNRVYASEFVSTNTGDPEIYSSTNLDITVGLKTYTLASNGGLQMPILSAAPTSPVIGATYVADNSGWDPASKPGTAPYPVFWDGVTYQALY